MKTKQILALSGLVLGLGMAHSANAITFDSNGASVGGEINGVETLDWAPSSALAVGGVNVPVGGTFQLLSQGFLTNFQDGIGNPILTNFNLNTAYQVTFVTSFQEQVLFTNQPSFPSSAIFSTTGSTAVPNFFEIYINTNPATFANAGAGTGFNSGTLIANGTILGGGIGTFATVLLPGGVPLDQFGANNRPGINSVGPGSGGTQFQANVAITDYDPNYFKAEPLGNLKLAFNTSQILPFQQVDPSLLFVTTHNPTLGTSGLAPAQPGATLGSVGPINGQSGPNIILQVDANTAVKVPEPGSLSLLGLSLLGMGFFRRRS